MGFEKTQLQEFKEAFEMIDSNRDGFIDKNDLKSTYMSLGVRNVDDGDIDKMMAEAPGALNFTTFLNMLAEKLHGTDSEDVILEAFKVLDPSGQGKSPTRFFWMPLPAKPPVSTRKKSMPLWSSPQLMSAETLTTKPSAISLPTVKRKNKCSRFERMFSRTFFLRRPSISPISLTFRNRTYRKSVSLYCASINVNGLHLSFV